MRVPHAERAIIAPGKLREYLLTPVKGRGRGKPPFFAALGYTVDNWWVLEQALREQHLVLDAQKDQTTEHGDMYVIIGPLTGPDGETASVKSVWITWHGEDAPRFVTAYKA